MNFKRNFPLDLLSEAQAVQALKAAGLPDRVAFDIALSCVDDVEWVMQMIEEEKARTPKSLTDDDGDDDDGDNDETPVDKKAKKEETDEE